MYGILEEKNHPLSRQILRKYNRCTLQIASSLRGWSKINNDQKILEHCAKLKVNISLIGRIQKSIYRARGRVNRALLWNWWWIHGRLRTWRGSTTWGIHGVVRDMGGVFTSGFFLNALFQKISPTPTLWGNHWERVKWVNITANIGKVINSKVE